MPPRDEKRRIAVISDAHLGDPQSTLKDSSVVDDLVDELDSGKRIDEFILLGDILDLAFSNFQDVIQQARKFFDRIRTREPRLSYMAFAY
jgi:UDP-2,3-diacylglucosamine pyrophosphatase LpxH